MKFNINKILVIIILILCSMQSFHTLESKIELQNENAKTAIKNAKTELKNSSNSKTNLEIRATTKSKSKEEAKLPKYEIPTITRNDFVRI
jgi:uncharacterized protein YxeA